MGSGAGATGGGAAPGTRVTARRISAPPLNASSDPTPSAKSEGPYPGAVAIVASAGGMPRWADAEVHRAPAARKTPVPATAFGLWLIEGCGSSAPCHPP